MPNNTTAPKAYLGYVCLRPVVTVRICEFCPDRAEAEKQAEAAKQAVKLGCCVDCHQKRLRALMGET